MNIEVEKINASEGPAFGAAILAMVGAGAFASVEQACEKLITATDIFTPNAEAVSLYNSHYPIYTGLYKALKDTFTSIAKV